ncbi:Replication protein A DNA-binding subunit C [Glycine soja]
MENKIHASILNKGLIPKYQGIQEEGATYIIQNILVAKINVKYKTTSHRFKLNFMGNTICSKIENEIIPKFQFNFMSFSDILSSTIEDVLINVIGHVPEKDNIKEIIKNGKRTKVMDIMLQDLEYNSLHCTLWEEYTEEKQKHLDQHDCPNPVVVVIQLCKLKKYLGTL